MNDQPTHYDTLGLAPGADPKAVKAAYRRLIRQYHPDITRQPDAEDTAKRINAAYAVLADPARRRAYDESLRPSLPGSPTPSTPRSYPKEPAPTNLDKTTQRVLVVSLGVFLLFTTFVMLFFSFNLPRPIQPTPRMIETAAARLEPTIQVVLSNGCRQYATPGSAQCYYLRGLDNVEARAVWDWYAALRLDPTYGAAHAALAAYYQRRWETRGQPQDQQLADYHRIHSP